MRRALRKDEVRVWAHGESRVFRSARAAQAYMLECQRWASDVHAVDQNGNRVCLGSFFGGRR